MTLTTKYKEFCTIFKIMENIVDFSYNDHENDWRIAYNVIFSEEVSQKLLSIRSFDWYDPNTTYKEDVLAFYRAAKVEYGQIEKWLEVNS